VAAVMRGKTSGAQREALNSPFAKSIFHLTMFLHSVLNIVKFYKATKTVPLSK
jgi:hypothetical protein